MTENTKGRYKISISYGIVSASFTQDLVTILEAKKVGHEMSKLLFGIEDVQGVKMNIEELAQYETQKGD